MQQLSRSFSGSAGHIGACVEGTVASSSPPLLEVVWRRRWVVVITLFACMGAAGIYLALGTRIYSATASVMIQQNGPKAYSDSQGFQAVSETFLQTQADVFRSTPVLSRALETVNYRTRKIFAKVAGDPVEWLRRGTSFKGEVPRKSA